MTTYKQTKRISILLIAAVSMINMIVNGSRLIAFCTECWATPTMTQESIGRIIANFVLPFILGMIPFWYFSRQAKNVSDEAEQIRLVKRARNIAVWIIVTSYIIWFLSFLGRVT